MMEGTQMNQLAVNDFFCGCGGMSIGFQNAGYEIAGAWDFDKHAVKSYCRNVGEHVKHADIKEMTWQDIPKAKVWAFGFPCQDLSIIGKRAGMALECISCGHQWKIDTDEHDSDNCPACGGNKYKSASRSGLFFEIMRLLDETEENLPEQMPKVLIAENVKGLKPFIGVLEAEFKKRGYTAYIELYNSKYWGVPQNRERYYIVGIKDGEGIPFKMPEEDKSPGKIPKLSTALETEVDEKYYISDDKAKTIIKQALERLEKHNYQHILVKDATKDAEPQISVLGMLDISTYEHSRRAHDPDGLSPTVTAVCGGTHHIKIFDYNRYRVRKLTPTEYGRLQAFPMDEWEQVVSDTQAYKQFGNAVTVTVATAVAEAIKEVLVPLKGMPKEEIK